MEENLSLSGDGGGKKGGHLKFSLNSLLREGGYKVALLHLSSL